jgi:hypothetical protein
LVEDLHQRSTGKMKNAGRMKSANGERLNARESLVTMNTTLKSVGVGSLNFVSVK